MPCSLLRALTMATALASAFPGPTANGDEPSPQRQAELRQLVEKRKRRRAARGGATAVGTVVPHPMPPSLIIRHTPQVHGEVEDLLRMLRGG